MQGHSTSPTALASSPCSAAASWSCPRTSATSTNGVYTSALTIVKANEKLVAGPIVVKEHDGAYTTGLAHTDGFSTLADCDFTALLTGFGAYTTRMARFRSLQCGSANALTSAEMDL